MKSRTQNFVSGRLGQQVGAAFESWLDGQHNLAKQIGIIAHVEKTEAHAKIVRGKLIYIKPGVADYIAVLEGGNYVALEAKSTSANNLPRSAVKPRQQEHLETVARAGGLALLLVEFRTTSVLSRFAIPWLEVPWRILRTAESTCASDLAKWLVTPGTCYLSKFHLGGPRSNITSPRRRVYSTD